MIITQTPLRVSFLGGGTDLPAFYEQEPGAVLSCSIDKYIYVILKRRFDRRIRVGYTRTELVEHVDEVEHDLVRESLRTTGVSNTVELSTMGDIPSRGSGLGSSSTVTVGLLHALWIHTGELPSRRRLADAACEVEIDRLGRPIGRQDQYAAAYGHLRVLKFSSDGVQVSEPLVGPGVLRSLSERLMLFYTGLTRSSATILSEQRRNTAQRMDTLRAMRDLVDDGRAALESGDVCRIGTLLDEGWHLKQSLASRITNPDIDAMYAAAKNAGALGGKICGAGGGGFLMVFCDPDRQDAVRSALADYRELPVALVPHGSRVLLNVDAGSDDAARIGLRETARPA